MAQNQQPGNVQLHPMFHANNTGLNYQDVITGNVDCIIPANVPGGRPDSLITGRPRLPLKK